ncbi:MAG TPA: EAL domain-containing protein [Candidatus Baltobacteraceae bacterium]|nr:EAL domain-containing protein [Candidatus Baltobacteraceae bacterium]
MIPVEWSHQILKRRVARDTTKRVDPGNEDWRSLFDEHPAPLIVYQMNSAQILAANAAFCESYGYDPDELAGQRFTEVCVPDAAYNELVDPANAPDAVRCRHQRRDGARLDVEVTTRYCMWLGEPACMALINDVTTRTRIERRLVQSEKRLERVQEIGGVGVFEIDFRSGERYWSGELRRQFGLHPDDALPETKQLDLAMVHPDDRELVQRAYEHAFEHKQTCRVDHRVIQPGGNVVWLQLQADIDYDDEGRAIRAIGTTVDITERKMAEQQLGFLAHYDPLTGLANRAHAITRLQNTLRTARRSNTYPALIFLDLDHFKTVNDSLGHDVGDQLLIEVGRRLSVATREKDCVARMGGDEFVIIITEVNNPQGAENVARRILSVLEQPVGVGGRDIFVTCSIGIAYCPSEGIEVEALLSRADMAMYQAKRSGRNRFCVYEDEMLLETVARMELEADLRHALDRDEFFLAYQPIVSIGDCNLSGVEALIRWRHPGGVRMPADFISIAEESDLIQMIGDWALREACRQAVVWNLHEGLLMSVNVSRRQLTDPQFVNRVLQIVEETGLHPRALQIEVTETALVTDIEKTHQSLSTLRAAGIRIAIDDFGTGYNSLANLRYSVIDALKIDRSFISDIGSSPNIAIAGAVVSAGRSLGVRVVAEGVETQEHYDILQRLGCNDAQGYWFSKPIEAHVFEDLYMREASSSRKSAYSA